MKCSNYRNDFVIVPKFTLIGIIWNILVRCCVKYVKDEKSVIKIIFDVTRESLAIGAEPFAIYDMVGVRFKILNNLRKLFLSIECEGFAEISIVFVHVNLTSA